MAKELSQADEIRLKAITPSLIEAIEGHGDKALLLELTRNLPQVSPALAHLFESKAGLSSCWECSSYLFS